MNSPASPSPRSQPTPSPGDEFADRPSRPWLSALADGDVSAVQQACEAWRSDAQARADWHTYHLIGDVLRSEDLVRDPAADAQFLARLRLRLADEPVPFAPESAPEPAASSSPGFAATPRRRAAWLVPVAAAAGVAAVATVLVLGQADPPAELASSGWALNGPAGAPTLAQSSAPSGVPAGGDSSSPTWLLAAQPAGERDTGAALNPSQLGKLGNAQARVLRDARLDHYLEAHRGALGVAVAVPGGAMRNAEVIVPASEPR